MTVASPVARLPFLPALLLLLLLLLLAPFLAPAPALAGGETAEAALVTGTAEARVVAPPASPRDAVRVFTSAMFEVEQGNAQAMERALAALDLEPLPAESREARGAELAAGLHRLLSSFTFKIDAIPEKPDGRAYTLPVGRERGVTVTLARGADGAWRFDHKATLARLERHLEALEKESREREVAEAALDPLLKSPRETMKHFLNAVSEGPRKDIHEAARALDLSRFDVAVRANIGRERAAMLIFVLNRWKFIHPVELPNDPAGPPFVLLRDAAGSIVLERVKGGEGEPEAWKFSARTVEELPALYDAYADRLPVDGVSDDVAIPLSVRMRDAMKHSLPSLLGRTLVLENWQWLGMAIIAFLGLLAGRGFTGFLRRAIRALFGRESLEVDRAAEARFIRPIRLFVTAGIWLAGLTALGLPPGVRTLLLVAVKLSCIVTGIWGGYRLMDVVGNYLQAKAERTANKFDDLLVPLVVRTLKSVAVAAGFIFIADTFAFDIDKILAGLGIGGLAFALAAKDTISNVFGSLTILIDRPFQIGDWVTIGDADGTVESVGVRSTRIRTFYNSLITIPNSQLTNVPIDNWGAREYRRISCTLGIAYDTPPEKIEAFCEAIRELVRLHPYTRKDYFHVYLNEFADSSLGVMLYCFVRTPDWSTELRERHRLFNDILRAAKRLEVEFAFPTRTLYLREEKAPAHVRVPPDAEAAFRLGRETGGGIALAGLGNPPVTPPPVTFG